MSPNSQKCLFGGGSETGSQTAAELAERRGGIYGGGARQQRALRARGWEKRRGEAGLESPAGGGGGVNEARGCVLEGRPSPTNHPLAIVQTWEGDAQLRGTTFQEEQA